MSYECQALHPTRTGDLIFTKDLLYPTELEGLDGYFNVSQMTTAPTGFEPVTLKLTASCTAVVLQGIMPDAMTV